MQHWDVLTERTELTKAERWHLLQTKDLSQSTGLLGMKLSKQYGVAPSVTPSVTPRDLL